MKVSIYGYGRRELLYLNFNQDESRFSCGTRHGFEIWGTQKIESKFARHWSEEGGVAIVEPLERTNLVVLVGGGPNPKYPPTKVMLWDDAEGGFVAELDFETEVLAVRIKCDLLCVTLLETVFVFRLDSLTAVRRLPTYNKLGLLALSPLAGYSTLLYPSPDKEGEICVDFLDGRRQEHASRFRAHKSVVSRLCCSGDGSLGATASERGTVVRVWDLLTGQQLYDLRRGTDRSQLMDVRFSSDCAWLCVSSDKGSVQIFGLRGQIPGAEWDPDVAEIQRASFSRDKRQKDSSWMGGLCAKAVGCAMIPITIMPCAPKQWVDKDYDVVGRRGTRCFARASLPEAEFIANIMENNVLVVVTASGYVHRFSMDPKYGGLCQELSSQRFIWRH